VLFGATGDLAHRKIFPALQALTMRGVAIPVVTVARSGMNKQGMIERLLDGLARFGDSKDTGAAAKLIENLQYVDGDYRDREIGKYVDDKELARLERYMTIR
jgi:glucose-6-phosphate 1-dehydrogenase